MTLSRVLGRSSRTAAAQGRTFFFLSPPQPHHHHHLHLSLLSNRFHSLADFSNKDPQNKNVVNCDEKLKSFLLGKSKVGLDELHEMIKLHFSKETK